MLKILKMTLEKYSIINSCKITVLVEDTPHKKKMGLLHKHGLSLLIEATSKNVKSKLLFDAGPSPEIIVNNLKILNSRLDDLDVIMLSHGHYDHLNGLLEVLKRTENPTPVIIHPKMLDPKFTYKPNLTYIGPRFNRSSIEAVRGILVPTNSPITIANGITTSGEITLETNFEEPKGFWKLEGNRFIKDLMIDERALIINLSTKGLIIVVGCAHRGIINTLRHAMRIMNEEKIHAVIGGFHLSKVDDEIIHTTVSELKK
ncbi:MAG: MBL fold metallo-hydrolase [Candidatus Bathyarchaeia archaeon]